MFQNESILLVADNSGAKKLLVIRCLGGSNRRYSHIGDLVIATVKQAIPNSDNIAKGQIVKALIVSSKKGFSRSEGLVKFSKNYAVIVGIQKGNKKIEPFQATRVFVPILREFGDWGYQKILSLAPEIV